MSSDAAGRDADGASPTGTAILAAHPRQRSAPATSAAGRSSSAWSLIVVFFSFKADNFFTAGNFTNMIVQMAGTTMLAYGVVFVLLIGEIDLSIGYVSGVAGVVVAELQIAAAAGTSCPGWLAIVARGRARAPRSALFQGSFVA